MSFEDKIKAAAKDAEGKLQATAGELSGNERMQTEGEAKQLQAHLINAAGALKDSAQQAATAISETIDGLTKGA